MENENEAEKMNVLKHETQDEAITWVTQTLEDCKAEESGWMNVTWRVKDGRIALGRVTMHKFPTGDFLASVGMLATHLFELSMQQSTKTPDPLPRAPFFNDRLIRGGDGANDG